MGGRSNTLIKTETTIGGVVVKNDHILTDISDIEKRDQIIVLKDNDDETVYHVFPVTSTTGAVTGWKSDTGAITLSDGTVL